VDSHPSVRPTWDSAGSVIVPAWPCTGWGLPGRRVAATPVRSYRTFSPLPADEIQLRPRRLGGLFLWHFPAGFPGSGCPDHPRPTVSGLSSSDGCLSAVRGCLAGKPNGRCADAPRPGPSVSVCTLRVGNFQSTDRQRSRLVQQGREGVGERQAPREHQSGRHEGPEIRGRAQGRKGGCAVLAAR
jgi:hypothetical protein